MLQLIVAGAMAFAMAQQTDTTITVRPGGRLEVDNYSGSVTVRSWNRNEVRVRATHDSRAEVEIEHRGSTVSVDASGQNGEPTSVNYTITVPRNFRVNVDGVNTSIDIADIDAEINAQTVQGAVTIRTIEGRVSAESVSGDVVIEGVQGHVSVDATNENVRLSNIKGDVEVDATNGWVTMLGIESSDVSVETVNGDVILGTTIRDGGSYSISTTNGTVTLGIPDGANATIEVSTYSGKVETALPLQMEKDKHGSYTLHTGSGSASISIDAFSGRIRLVRPDQLRDVTTRQKKK